MLGGLEQLLQICTTSGEFSGTGVNHEGQTFAGRISFRAVLGGRGIRLHYTATGFDGTVFHEEDSLIAPSMEERLVLWNFNTNTPGLLPHDLRAADSKSGAASSFIFGFNQPSDTTTFREEVALVIWDERTISYTYSWALPGEEFQERSSVRMSRV